MKKIQDIAHFILYQEGVISLTGNIRNRNVYYWKNENLTALLESAVIPSFQKDKENIILFFPQKSIIINKELELTEFNGFIVKQILQNNDFVGYKIKGEEQEFLCYYSTEDGEIKWLCYDQLYFHLLSNNILVCEKIILEKKHIVAIQLKSGAILWQFSLSSLPPYKDIWGKEKPAEIIQILGIYENVLWVHIANFRLIGIDVKKGELLHYFDNLLKGKSGNVFLDDLLGRIKILSYDYYGEFDLETLSFIKEETVQCTDDVKIRASNFIKGDKNLYFCGYHNESLHPNAFGIFDTEKAEIIWYETTKDDLGYFYNPPQASEKLLAILDDKQNLLIYERD